MVYAMKFITTCIFLFIYSQFSLRAQTPEVKFLVDTSIAIMKMHAVNRDKVDWKKLESAAAAEMVNKKNAYQLGPLYRMLFQSLNDFHGAFYCWDSTYKYVRESPAISDSIMNEWKKGVTLKKMIVGENIGYLRVPYMSFTERTALDKKAQDLNDSLCWLLDKNVTGIVLDLRLNGGGAMYPMMLGLEQILGEGKLGSFEAEGYQSWIIKNNSFFLDTLSLTGIVPKCSLNKKDIPVVILIGPGTGSSGEFLAISFKKRKNTIFLGTTTAGYVTTTKGFKINDAVSLLLAVGYGRDREGEIYERALSPDVVLDEPDSFNDIGNDKKVLAAIAWIKGKM